MNTTHEPSAFRIGCAVIRSASQLFSLLMASCLAIAEILDASAEKSSRSSVVLSADNIALISMPIATAPSANSGHSHHVRRKPVFRGSSLIPEL